MKTKKTVKTDTQKELAKTKRDLNALVKAVREYDSLRDEEWNFEEDHGYDRNSWNAEDCEAQERLLADILEARRKVEKILRRVTGDKNLKF